MVKKDDVEIIGDGVGVLIVDADKQTRAFFTTILNKVGGFKIWTCATIDATMALFDTINYKDVAIIVFDPTCNVLKGHLLLQKIKTDNRLTFADILTCSDKFEEQDLFLLKEFGLNYSIKKRSGAGDFLMKINEIIDNQKKNNPRREILRDLESAILSKEIDKIKTIINTPDLMANVENDEEFVPFIGEYHILENEIKTAINLLSNFLKNNAESGKGETLKTLSVLGKALCLDKRFDEALKIFDKLSNKSPKNLGHIVGSGEALLGKGDIVGAEKKFNSVLNEDANHKDAKIGITMIKLAEGNTDDALNILKTIGGNIESYSLASYFNNAAVAYIKQGKINNAIKLFENALQFFEKHRNLIYFNLGLANLKIGKVEEACNCFERIIEYNDSKLIERKIILQEYRNNGIQYMINKYKNTKNNIPTEEDNIH